MTPVATATVMVVAVVMAAPAAAAAALVDSWLAVPPRRTCYHETLLFERCFCCTRRHTLGSGSEVMSALINPRQHVNGRWDAGTGERESCH